MNKAEFIKGINMAIEGLNLMRNAVESEKEGKAPASTPAPANKPAIGGKKAPAKTVPASKEATPSTNGQTYSAAELTAMKYNEFKKLASSLGVDCKGTRDEIMARVVALGVVTDDGGEAPAPKTAPKANKPAVGGSKSNKPANSGGLNANKSSAPAKDEFDDKAEEVAKTTELSDIIEALKEVGVKATKLNYKKMLAKALREGLLELGDDEGEAGGVELSADSYFEEYDIYGVNDPKTMSDERAAACTEKQDSILNAVTSGELSADDIVDFLQNMATQEEVDLLGGEYTEEDLVKLYCEVCKHFIDNDGAEHEPGEAYMVNDEAFCCGATLAYDEASNKFLCSQCAGEYDAQ